MNAGYLYLVYVTPRQRKIGAIVSRLLEWYPENARDLPWRRTTDPYPVFVSEIMLQQTQVKTVIPYWERWMRALPDIQSLARANPRKLHKLWEGLGYYTRVRNMHRAAKVVVAQHNGKFPEQFDQILALPGIGRYTAGAISSIAFHQPRPILDGNVMRVLCRLFGIEGDPRGPQTNAELWSLAQELVANASSLKSRAMHPVSAFNQSLMELGALICTPRQPRCAACPAAKLCIARRQNRIGDLPALKPRVATTQRRFAAFVVQNKNKFLVRQRPPSVVNAHLWEFPNTEVDGKELRPLEFARQLFGEEVVSVAPLIAIRHTITRYRITLEAFTVEAGAFQPKFGVSRWRSLEQLRRLPFSSAHKKILATLDGA